MKILRRVIRAICLLTILLFCVFGFLATFEPLEGGKHLLWRIGYGLGGVACIVAIAFVFRREFRSRSSQRNPEGVFRNQRE